MTLERLVRRILGMYVIVYCINFNETLEEAIKKVWGLKASLFVGIELRKHTSKSILVKTIC